MDLKKRPLTLFRACLPVLVLAAQLRAQGLASNVRVLLTKCSSCARCASSAC